MKKIEKLEIKKYIVKLPHMGESIIIPDIVLINKINEIIEAIGVGQEKKKRVAKSRHTEGEK